MKNKTFICLSCSLGLLFPLASQANGYFIILNPSNSPNNASVVVSNNTANNTCPTTTLCSDSPWDIIGGFHPYDATSQTCEVPAGDDSPTGNTNVFVATTTNGDASGCLVITNYSVGNYNNNYCSLFYSYDNGGSLTVKDVSCANAQNMNITATRGNHDNNIDVTISYPSASTSPSK